MVTKRELERKLADLEAQKRTDVPEDDDRERIEACFDGMYMYEPEPDLTNALGSLGFVVERDVQDYANGGAVRLRTTPSAGDILGTVGWRHDGPTADHNDIRIIWEADRLEQVRADAEHPTVYTEPDVPDAADRTVVAEGDGWKAVVPSDRLITNMVQRRSKAESHGFDILGPVELPLEDTDQYDLVEVDAAPDEDRQPRRPDV